MPDKPEREDEQISMLWDAVYNHIPHRLDFLNVKINFILAFIALVLALLGVIILK